MWPWTCLQLTSSNSYSFLFSLSRDHIDMFHIHMHSIRTPQRLLRTVGNYVALPQVQMPYVILSQRCREWQLWHPQRRFFGEVKPPTTCDSEIWGRNRRSCGGGSMVVATTHAHIAHHKTQLLLFLATHVINIFLSLSKPGWSNV